MRGSRVGLMPGDAGKDPNGRNYVSHSPQPYSKFKLQPTKNTLMIYGQNAQGAPGNDSTENRTLNGSAIIMTGRNANGYPVQNNFDKNALTKNSVKNMERYSKGSFVQNSSNRKGAGTKAHSNNPNASHKLRDQGNLALGLPQVSKNGTSGGEEYEQRRSGNFSPTGASNSYSATMLNGAK